MKALKKIVIVGGGTSGWIAASVLAAKFNSELLEVELVESDEIGTIGVGESTIPPFLGLLRVLGINERDFIQYTQASFKLGINFANWKIKGESYFHPFGRVGDTINQYEFYQCWLKLKMAGSDFGFQDFSPAHIMAKNGRFMAPQDSQPPISTASYALHLDAKLAAKYLRMYAEAKGVKRTEGIVQTVVKNEKDFIEKLVLADGCEITGEFFIDCTGFKALLLNKNLGVGYHDWSNYLPCNRAVAVQTENTGDTTPFTRATAQDSGWSWRIPLQHRTGNGYVYSSEYCSDDEAIATLLKAVDGKPLMDPKVIPFTTGVRHDIWKNNCLALGLASGFIEPLESTAIHLVVRGMEYLLRFFPDLDFDAAPIAEYNRRMIADYEEIRDFIVLHYCTTQREDTPFWRWCKNMELPPTLVERMTLFKAQGALRDGVEELFREDSWYSVYEGMGVRPAKFSPQINNLNEKEISRVMESARGYLANLVLDLPTHDEFLQKYCPAIKPNA